MLEQAQLPPWQVWASDEGTHHKP